MSIFDTIHRPTLIIDRDCVQANIRRMAAKAASQGVRFRPHFKTHQSAVVGEWFRAEGVKAITVSSVEMAVYFAQYGWDDITIAFPVNPREIELICALARQIRLGLLVESAEMVDFLESQLDASADVWIKVDVGTHRTGLPWDHPAEFLPLLERLGRSKLLHLRGLLTHAGYTYKAENADGVCRLYRESVQRMLAVREALVAKGAPRLEISVGDTPGNTLCEEIGPVDEIRPGNFVFYDGQQLVAGVSRFEQVAGVVACPVVARHPDRREVVVYGGAIHFAKDTLLVNDRPVFGLICLPQGEHWGPPLPGAYLVRLSQEHGIIELPLEAFDRVKVGDLLCVIPAHVCLTVSALRRYVTLEGEWIETL
jgi:D-serine deaminase-like pyridoxal phosphate-dependent protein